MHPLLVLQLLCEVLQMRSHLFDDWQLLLRKNAVDGRAPRHRILLISYIFTLFFTLSLLHGHIMHTIHDGDLRGDPEPEVARLKPLVPDGVLGLVVGYPSLCFNTVLLEVVLQSCYHIGLFLLVDDRRPISCDVVHAFLAFVLGHRIACVVALSKIWHALPISHVAVVTFLFGLPSLQITTEVDRK